jgi:hypothetical protein
MAQDELLRQIGQCGLAGIDKEIPPPHPTRGPRFDAGSLNHIASAAMDRPGQASRSVQPGPAHTGEPWVGEGEEDRDSRDDAGSECGTASVRAGNSELANALCLPSFISTSRQNRRWNHSADSCSFLTGNGSHASRVHAAAAAGQGLAAQISYVSDGMRELVRRLADARLNEVAMTVLRVAAVFTHRWHSLGFFWRLPRPPVTGRVEIALRESPSCFKQEACTPAEVEQIVVRRALTLIALLD